MGYIGIIGGYFRGYIGVMEKKTETTTIGLYRDSITGYIGRV